VLVTVVERTVDTPLPALFAAADDTTLVIVARSAVRPTSQLENSDCRYRGYTRGEGKRPTLTVARLIA
jgi:hypothetical protein